MKQYIFTLALAGILTACTGEINYRYADYVDTTVGVIDNRGSNCVIGPQLPYGSINPSPQTERGSMDGYHPKYPIRGFGQLHVSGTGWGSYGHFLVSPQIGLAVGATEHDSPHSEDITRAITIKPASTATASPPRWLRRITAPYTASPFRRAMSPACCSMHRIA